MQEVMERPERRRREGRRLVRFAFGRRSSLFCVPVFFLYLCLLWVYVFYGFYVGPAKLQRGATPPSVMVLFTTTFIQISEMCILCPFILFSFPSGTTRVAANHFQENISYKISFMTNRVFILQGCLSIMF